jgi:hypothetical protein
LNDFKFSIDFFFNGDARVYSRLSKNNYFEGKSPAQKVAQNLKNIDEKILDSFHEVVCNLLHTNESLVAFCDIVVCGLFYIEIHNYYANLTKVAKDYYSSAHECDCEQNVCMRIYLEAGELMRLVPGERRRRREMLWLVINVALIRRPIK